MSYRKQLDSTELRKHLPSSTGRRFWRSLEELSGSDEFAEMLAREFPQQATQLLANPSRRRFLQLMGASLALAGLQGCGKQPQEKIVPYVRQPEQIVPGKPLFYATAMTLGGFSTGLLAETHEGRPTKIEGNPDHRHGQGGTDVFAQAEILSLYDPDRSETVLNGGEISTWSDFVTSLRGQLESRRATNGRGLRILTETVTSPTHLRLLQQVRDEFPESRWHQYEPVNEDALRAATKTAFGKPVHLSYRFDAADVVLSLDADFATCGPGRLRNVRDFMRRRQVVDSPEAAAMNRLYVAESTPSPTGSVADHRLPLKSSSVPGFALALAKALDVEVGDVDSPNYYGDTREWLSAVTDDLRSRPPGSTLVLAGDGQPPHVHALVLAINERLGNVGATVVVREPLVQETPGLAELAADMTRGEVAVLMMLGGNPIYNAPADLEFGDALSHVPFRVHLSPRQDETSALCHWHIPQAHFLESWGDTRAFDGTVSFIQPTIAPLYHGKTGDEILASLLKDYGNRTSYDLVRETWQTRHGKAGFEEFWQRGLHDGVVPGTEAARIEVSLDSEAIRQAIPANRRSQSDSTELEIVFRPDPCIWDGRYANNGWLQELPRPTTTLTWDNAALISPATAERLGLQNEDVVEIRHGERTLDVPVWIVPGHAKESVTVHLGHGRTRAGSVGNGSGFDAYQLRTSASPGFATGVSLRKTGRRFSLAVTQHHHLMAGRDLMRVGTPAELRANPERPAFMQTEDHEHPAAEALTFYDDSEHYSPDENAWAMNINLNACTGCNACVVACQSENNIPVVGKEEVIRGREMHWIRVDSYFEGDAANPAIYHQPVTCMQCEHAPCEIVCPVGATVHSDEGLNDMVYNRCVGTRYCSNNCPYKVRRFNFLVYNDFDSESLKLQRNPDVTVRAQGVMEKCTYCVQRISAARIEAKKEDRPVRDGEIVTACQSACPTEAIVFGNRNDADSRVAKLSGSPLNYAMMAELNTRPRTTYLAALRNPNPALERTEKHDRPS